MNAFAEPGLSPIDRQGGALYGAAIGDALAMPVHWYYDRYALQRDYGVVDSFLAPRNPHPDSILWRSHYRAANEKGEILHDQARWWGQREIHYHQFLAAGENTLTWQLARLTMVSLESQNGYDKEDFLRRYVQFMTTPGSHDDTYLEECHRGFFENLAAGERPGCCAVEEKHIGGLAGVVPVVSWYRNDRAIAIEMAKRHVGVTHAGDRMSEAVSLVAGLLWDSLDGRSLEELILEEQSSQANIFARHPFKKWLSKPDEQVIGRLLSPACYLEDALPATLYLALKYADRPREGLIANTMLGGDNVHRGIVLGALLGAENGWDSWPSQWRKDLKDKPEWKGGPESVQGH